MGNVFSSPVPGADTPHSYQKAGGKRKAARIDPDNDDEPEAPSKKQKKGSTETPKKGVETPDKKGKAVEKGKAAEMGKAVEKGKAAEKTKATEKHKATKKGKAIEKGKAADNGKAGETSKAVENSRKTEESKATGGIDKKKASKQGSEAAVTPASGGVTTTAVPTRIRRATAQPNRAAGTSTTGVTTRSGATTSTRATTTP